MESRVPLTAVSLFSGAGGMDAGFRQAGFDIVLGADRNSDASSTYCLNHPETLFHFGDVLDSPIYTLGINAPDVVFGGPPCQGFSIAGARDPRHPSNELIWAFVKSVRVFRPMAFVMENVPGLLTVQNGRLLDEIVRTFESFDERYNVQLEILNAVQFGVPQVRRRIFLVGTRPGIRYHFPRPRFFRGLYVTVAEAISDLPIEPTSPTGVVPYPTRMGENDYQRARRRGCHAVYNFNCKKLESLRLSRIGHLEEGDNKRAIPTRLQPADATPNTVVSTRTSLLPPSRHTLVKTVPILFIRGCRGRSPFARLRACSHSMIDTSSVAAKSSSLPWSVTQSRLCWPKLLRRI